MRGRFGALLLLLSLLAGFVPLPPAAADPAPPVVSAYWWEPRYAIQPQNVTLFATVSDLDGIFLVQATWCTVPPQLCTFPTLTDPDGDGTFNGTGSAYLNAHGASFRIWAEDSGGNGSSTSRKYALFPTALNLTFDAEVVMGAPSQSVTVNGTAFYEENVTAPAEGVTVSISLASTIYRATVDAAGSFTVDLPAPSAEGTYPINATATDRSLTGIAHSTMAVSSVPKPDLTIEDVVVGSPVPLRPGSSVSIFFNVRNLGSENATAARLVVTIASGPVETVLLDERVSVPKEGGSVARRVDWTASGAGTFLVRITVDPDNEIQELGEGNNLVPLDVTVDPALTPSGPSILVWAGVVAAGATAAIGVAFWALRRRQKVL